MCSTVNDNWNDPENWQQPQSVQSNNRPPQQLVLTIADITLPVVEEEPSKITTLNQFIAKKSKLFFTFTARKYSLRQHDQYARQECTRIHTCLT